MLREALVCDPRQAARREGDAVSIEFYEWNLDRLIQAHLRCEITEPNFNFFLITKLIEHVQAIEAKNKKLAKKLSIATSRKRK